MKTKRAQKVLKSSSNAIVLKLSRKSFPLWHQSSQENYENWIFTAQHIQTTSFPFLSSSFVQISHRKPLRWYRIADVKSHLIKAAENKKKRIFHPKKPFSSIPQNIGFCGKHQKMFYEYTKIKTRWTKKKWVLWWKEK